MSTLINIGGWLVVTSGTLFVVCLFAIAVVQAFVYLRRMLWEVDAFMAFAFDRHGKRDIAEQWSRVRRRNDELRKENEELRQKLYFPKEAADGADQ